MLPELLKLSWNLGESLNTWYPRLRGKYNGEVNPLFDSGKVKMIC